MIRQAHREQHWAAVGRLANRLHACAQQRVYWANWVDSLELAIEAAEHLGGIATPELQRIRTEARARAHFAFGDSLIIQERIDEALPHLTQARELFGEIGQSLDAASAALGEGYVKLESAQLDDAEPALLAALATFREHRRADLEAEALADVGLLYLRQLKLPEAIEHLSACVEVFRRIDNPNWLAYALVSLGEAQLAAATGPEDHAAALLTLGDALPLLELLINRPWSAHTLKSVGDTFALHGDRRSARRAWRRALVIMELFESPEAARLRNQLAWSRQLIGWIRQRTMRPKEVGNA